MSNTKENEDESAAQPVPTPLATDDPVIADGKLESVEQFDHASQQPLTDPAHHPNPNPSSSPAHNPNPNPSSSPAHNPNPNPSSSPAPEPIDKDKLLLAEDENPALPTETGSSNDIADLKPATEQSQQDSTSPALLPDDKSSLKPDTEPATDDKAEAILTPDSKSKASAGNGNETSDSEAFTCNETETPVSKISATDGTENSKSGTFIGDANGIESSKSEMTAVNGTDLSDSKTSPGCGTETSNNLEVSKPSTETKIEHSEVPENSSGHDVATVPKKHGGPATPLIGYSRIKAEVDNARQSNNDRRKVDLPTAKNNGNSSSKNSFLLDDNHDGNESGTEEEQLEFMKELDNFFREKKMEFKPPKFYGEGLNCLKLWRAVMKLGGYDKVTSCKLWRQVGESFKPPNLIKLLYRDFAEEVTCTTVSWTFRGFYEKALLDYERHKISGGEVTIHVAPNPEPMIVDSQASGSGRARRDAAARAMQGWHEQRLIGHGEVSYPIIKDKNLGSSQKREKQIKSLGLLKRKQPSYMEDSVKTARTKSSKSQLRLDVEVVDIGPPADWVKINVLRTKECFEVYALVPGLLREEVRVQSDPAGRLVISGEPEHPDNPWGVTPFKKVVSLPSRIDPHQTSAVVTLHGQLLVRVPFEQSD